MKSASCSLAQESNFHDFIVHSLVGPKVVMLEGVQHKNAFIHHPAYTLHFYVT